LAELSIEHRTRTGGRPTRPEAERRLERVLEIARRRFLADGYCRTSLETIAREGGIAKKTLYHHFGSKEGLFAAILDSLRQAWAAELRDMTLRPHEPERVLERVALHLLDVGTRPDMVALHRMLLAEAPRFPELVQQHYDCNAPRGMEPLHDYLSAAVSEGRLRLADVALAAEQFTHLVLGGVRTRQLLGVSRRPSRSERRLIARQAVDIFLRGCGGECASANARSEFVRGGSG
jgi:AcrR family transcriptional regulator